MSIAIVNQKTCKVCENPHLAQGYCSLHYRRLLKSGELSTDKQYFKRTLEERFWQFVERTDECWVWHGARNSNGYGHLTYKGKNIAVHRFSYELHSGPIKNKLFVLHSCDQCGCVNPLHLFTGSQQTNMDDKVSKQRQERGEKHHNAKLTDKKVIEIYRLLDSGLNCAKIAKIYNMGYSAIECIKKGLTWNHIPRP